MNDRHQIINPGSSDNVMSLIKTKNTHLYVYSSCRKPKKEKVLKEIRKKRETKPTLSTEEQGKIRENFYSGIVQSRRE